MSSYDYLIVGAGLFGSVFAHEATKQGKTCLVIDKRDHIGGNCYTEAIAEVNVHKYGAHIFRTANKNIWDYMQQFCEFNHFVNSPVANYHGELFNLPFNMNTFNQMWGVVTPAEAQAKIAEQQLKIKGEPKNLEEHVISLVGTDIYKKLVKEYTEKQWGKPCTELPASLIRRLPLRFIFDNNYFNDPWQGVPKGGYTKIFDKMLASCDIKLGVDYNEQRQLFDGVADYVIYTGTIDSYFDYACGELEYRGLRFETSTMDCTNFQGVAVMNYTDKETPYTRSIEHKHFEFGQQEKTVVSYEYPMDWTKGDDAYYPMEDELNKARYNQYAALAAKQKGIHFGGRLGEYRYYDMQETIVSALDLCAKLL
ncbi:MAG: UDP-galactopyranose mutase [Coriobacteriales bacterium]|nr:UDP-galactopyranose mutase [Coriobacteriales bacterium]